MSGSCAKEPDQEIAIEEEISVLSFYDKGSIEKAELAEKLTYKNYHLTKLMEEVLQSNPYFDQQLSIKPGKGNYMGFSYFKDLLNAKASGKGQRELNDSIRFSLQAFVGLEDESWFPHIEKIKEGKGDSPLFLINSFDPNTEREIVLGYTLNGKGKLELQYKDVSEEDVFGSESSKATLGNDIYALALTAGSQELFQQEAQDCEGCGGSGSSGGAGPGNETAGLEIEKIKIMDKKESWLEKADVLIYGYSMSENPNYFDPLGYYWGIRKTKEGAQIRNNPEYKLAKFSTSDVTNGTFKTIDHHLMNESKSTKVFISYIIYEYDGFPAPIKQVYFNRPGGTKAVIAYRSYNQKYFAGQVCACEDFVPAEFFVLGGFGNTIKNNVIEFKFNPQN